MKRVLVTGANGFIGRHVTPLLVENSFEVHCVDIKLSEKREPYVHWHQTDLMDPEGLIKLMLEVKPTHLLHFAWITVPGEYWTSTENIKWIEGSLQLLRVFQKNGGQRVVMAGTCAEYDWNYGYCSEDITPLVPSTLYGTSKNALQLILKDFSRVTGLSSAWGRIFFLYGPYEHQNRLVSSVILNLLKNKTAPCSHGNQIRDFLYVEDVASAFVALLMSEANGPVNIASGLPVALKDVIRIIADQLKREDLVELGIIPVPESDPPMLVGDVRRLSNEILWKPRYNLETGIQKSIQWWKTEISK